MHRYRAVALLTAACGSDPGDASPPGSGGDGTGPAVATFEVAGDEQFKVELIHPDDVAAAQAMLDGKERQRIPLGVVVRGDAGVNAPWSWHIDPEQFEFADFTIEVCDGLPSYVEDHTITSETYCPWSAKIVALEPV